MRLSLARSVTAGLRPRAREAPLLLVWTADRPPEFPPPVPGWPRSGTRYMEIAARPSGRRPANRRHPRDRHQPIAQEEPDGTGHHASDPHRGRGRHGAVDARDALDARGARPIVPRSEEH